MGYCMVIESVSGALAVSVADGVDRWTETELDDSSMTENQSFLIEGDIK